jgi:N-methylhydantoinase A/oxoprolinase/acetone carboxylase beta subunit
VVSNGRPAVRAEGALVGGWRTMVEAVDVRTVGLGGDSEVYFDRRMQLNVGPRKAMPLSLLAHTFPRTLEELKTLAEQPHLPEFATQFAFRNPDRSAPAHLSSSERRAWEALSLEPRHVSGIVRSTSGLEALRRLADAGLATIATFTPSDAMHVLGRQEGWNREAAECGARILAIEERNARAASSAASPAEMSERTREHVIRETVRVLLASALANDPGLEASAGGWGVLGERLVADTCAGRSFSTLMDAKLQLGRPLIAIGAPVGAYYPDVARRLGSPLSIPQHAAVCNAVGAVAGVVSQTVEILVNQPTFKVFRVHDPAGSRDYPDPDPALEHAHRISRDLALEAARRAGAADPHVETEVIEKRAQVGPGSDYLAEALVRATAVGRPVVSH